MIAEACSPALWAKAETPTYGWWVEGVRLTTSAMACEMRVISASAPSGSTVMPYLSSRAATTGKRLALPTRSPYPLAVHWTWVAPASTAARVLATAHPVSSWAWMPSRAPVSAMTVETTAWIWAGSMPPLVSQRMTTSAPASYAARTTDFAYAALAR